MIKIFKPPQKVSWDQRKSVFLAGTIDNGDSVDWQARVEKELADLDVTILNPRRDEWDAALEQTIENEIFRAQVNWELDGLDGVSQIFMYFAPGSKSPITLLELGLYAQSSKLVIVCPTGFWRRGNIEVVADKYKIPLFESLNEGLSVLRSRLT